jgi:hypothetical protein
MSWRTTQLNNKLCRQDQIILDLFKDKSVRYISNDLEFAAHLSLSQNSKHIIAILNKPFYLSELIKFVKDNLVDIETFYFGINRYHLIGNDTNLLFDNITNSKNIINLISKLAVSNNCNVTQSGHFDNDNGRYFNFVQPLTWAYGSNISN